MKDICCIGHITKDKIVTPRNTVYMAGGTSFYMAWGMNQLPPKASFQLVTKVAKEDMAEVERMRQAGIEVVCHDSEHTVYFEINMVIIPTTVLSVCWQRLILLLWTK